MGSEKGRASFFGSRESNRGGVDYREAIVSAIKDADIVIILLNEPWALSGECYDEYTYAKRLNLTSHERGATKRGDPRKPSFIPIAFSGLDWKAHQHVELLAATTNFIVHKGETLLEGSAEPTLDIIGVSIKRLGMKIDISGDLGVKIKTMNLSNEKTDKDNKEKPYDLSTELSEIFFGLQGLTSRMNEALLHQNTQSQKTSEIMIGTLKVGNRYLGNSLQNGVMNDGNLWAYWQSCELVLNSYDQKSNSVNATVTRKELRKLVNGSNEVSQKLPKYLQVWLTNFGEAKEHCSGTFNPATGLLAIKTYEVDIVAGTGSSWTKKDYHLVAFGDKLIGPSFETGKDSANAESAANILQQF